MRTFRTALTVVALSLLAGGYAASQWALFTGSAADYASRIDNPSVKWLSLMLIVIAMVLMFIPDRVQDGE